MAVKVAWQQSESYTASQDRAVLTALSQRVAGTGLSRDGLFLSTGLDGLVTATGTPNMQTHANPFYGMAAGYEVRSDAVVDLTHAAANPTNPRNDLVIYRVRDTEAGDGVSDGTVELVTGTPNAVPVDPTLPARSVVLARVNVPANDTAISSGQITDLRKFTAAAGGVTPVVSDADAATLPLGALFYNLTTDESGIVASAGRRSLLPKEVTARLGQSANQNMTGAAINAVANWVVVTDPDGYYNAADSFNRIKIPAGKAGLYALVVRFVQNTTAGSRAWVQFVVNNAVTGTTESRGIFANDDSTTYTWVTRLSALDIVKVEMFCSVASTTVSSRMRWDVHYLGR